MDPLLALASQHADRYLENIRERHVGARTDAPSLRRLLGGALPDTGADAQTVIDALGNAGADGTVATQGPRYFGFVVGGSFRVATAADWLVSAWDQNTGIYALSPITSIIEEIVTSWVTDLLGLEGPWSAGFVTGGQMANFTCLVTARHHVLEKVGWDVENKGLSSAPSIDVIVSDEPHYSIGTSLRMMGLGADRVQRVPTDHQGRMRLEAVEAALSRHTGPCIVCTQVGNVNTGAVDPIAAIIALARRRDAWVHVDGAFGAWAAVSPSRKHLVDGIAQADSVATDAHKWLNVPYDCGIALTAHPQTHRRAFTVPAAYIQETKEARDPHEFTPEESRRGRAIPIYAVLRALGKQGLTDLIDRCCTLAQRMAARLSQHPRVTILNEVVLNQVLLRCVPESGTPADADAFVDAVIDTIQRDGTCWLGGTTWKGARAIRISVSNWSTTEADADRSAEAILQAIDRVQR
jgi:glutamate/tyrosine decarboxylase-like PLP-dependent enzyme